MQMLSKCKLTTLTYLNRANSFIIKHAIVLNIILVHNLCNIRDRDVVLCIIIVLLKCNEDLDHYCIQWHRDEKRQQTLIIYGVTIV